MKKVQSHVAGRERHKGTFRRWLLMCWSEQGRPRGTADRFYGIWFEPWSNLSLLPLKKKKDSSSQIAQPFSFWKVTTLTNNDGRAPALTNCRLPFLSWRPQRCIFGTEESDAWLRAKDMLLRFSFSCCFIYFFKPMTLSESMVLCTWYILELIALDVFSY